MNYNYCGYFISVYPFNSNALTGTSPSEGNDHITLFYFGQRVALEMRQTNVGHIRSINRRLLNKTGTATEAVIDEFMDSNDDIKYSVIYLLDEVTNNTLQSICDHYGFIRDPDQPPFHISHSYHNTHEDAMEALREANQKVPFSFRMGACYDR